VIAADTEGAGPIKHRASSAAEIKIGSQRSTAKAASGRASARGGGGGCGGASGGGGGGGGGGVAERNRKSEFYNFLQVGLKVKIRKNNKAGHHDVTTKHGELNGAEAIIVKAPVYPNTWVTLKNCSDGSIVKARELVSRIVSTCG
jgi:hypothetical protein